MGTPERKVGRYNLLRKLGEGGMAEVHLARAEGASSSEPPVVLKCILPGLAEDRQFVDLFLHEARLASQLHHPNIVRVIEFGQAGDTWFIAMEYVDGLNGRSLGLRAAQARARVAWPLVARIVGSACEALAYAHDLARDGKPLQIVHRDISPDNLLIGRDGVVKLTDFGLAKATSSPFKTGIGIRRGKSWYMSPEQVRGESLDRRSDIFSLGTLLYELLSGVLPFEGLSPIDIMGAIANAQPAPLERYRKGCPAGLLSVIARALEKDREARYPDCRAMLADLERVLAQAHERAGAPELAALVQQLAPASEAPEESPPADTLPTEPVIDTRPRPCPLCAVELHAVVAAGVRADGCPRCGGLWFDGRELLQLANRPGGLVAVAMQFPRSAPPPARPGAMPCPRCDNPLQSFEFASLPGIVLERCEVCRGVWLDAGDAEAIQTQLEG